MKSPGSFRRAPTGNRVHRLAVGLVAVGTESAGRAGINPVAHLRLCYRGRSQRSQIFPVDAGGLLRLCGGDEPRSTVSRCDPTGRSPEGFPNASAVFLAGRARSNEESKLEFRTQVLWAQGVDCGPLPEIDRVDADLGPQHRQGRYPRGASPARLRSHRSSRQSCWIDEPEKDSPSTQ